MPLTVDRQELINHITAKRDEVVQRAQEAVTAAQAAWDAEKGETVGAYLRTLADHADKGSVRVSATQYQGGAQGYLEFVWKDRVAGGRPKFPNQNAEQIKRLENALAEAEAALVQAPKPYDASLTILNMSQDATVDVIDGGYTKLLEG